jgi:hypothetical protein
MKARMSLLCVASAFFPLAFPAVSHSGEGSARVVAPGDVVRIWTTSQPHAEFNGRVLRVLPGALVLDTAGVTEPLPIPLNSITRLLLQTPGPRNTRKGAIIGAITGGLLGAVIGGVRLCGINSEEGSSCPDTFLLEGTLGGAAVGGLIGAAIGSLGRGSPRWKPVPLATTSRSSVRLVPRTNGFSVSIVW